MKRVTATTDPVEAGILRALLRDAGIESTLENEGGADFAIGMSTSAIPLWINVGDEDIKAAEEILAAHFTKHPLPMDDDPEAPEPISSEESARMEAKAQVTSSRWRYRLLAVYLFPAGVMMAVSIVVGDLTQALMAGASVLSFITLVWFINRLVKSQVKGKGPAS